MSGRLLITGSREWSDWDTIRHALAVRYQPDTILVTGACPRGADAIAECVWRNYGGTVERHPANWAVHGNAAGPIRNKTMVDLGADECLAFIKDASPGATGCADFADKAGIPTRRYTVHAVMNIVSENNTTIIRPSCITIMEIAGVESVTSRVVMKRIRRGTL